MFYVKTTSTHNCNEKSCVIKANIYQEIYAVFTKKKKKKMPYIFFYIYTHGFN